MIIRKVEYLSAGDKINASNESSKGFLEIIKISINPSDWSDEPGPKMYRIDFEKKYENEDRYALLIEGDKVEVAFEVCTQTRKKFKALS